MDKRDKIIVLLLLVLAVLIYLFANIRGYIPETEPKLHKYPEMIFAWVWL